MVHTAQNPVGGDEHKVSVEELYKRFGSSRQGLASVEAARRAALYGQNVLDVKEKTPLIVKFARHLVDLFALLLWTGAILAFIAESVSPGEGYAYIGGALIFVVVLNAVFTFIQEYQSEKIMESFARMMPLTIEALRDSSRVRIDAGAVVPGDVIFLEEGDRVPADCRLIQANALKVDNSSLTGESEPQLRKLECTHVNMLESRNMVFSGTTVQSGDGVALVYGTAMNTQIGNIAGLTRATGAVASPLRKELNHFVRVISVIAVSIGAVFFVIGMFSGNPFMANVIFAIGIIVANVPEGLHPTVTLALSMASKKMARKKALIRRLESVETLGSTTVICTDKTGTITENRMAVKTVFIDMDERHVDEVDIAAAPGFDEFLRVAVLCNNARSGNGGYFGDPTDRALMSFAASHADIERITDKNRRTRESPFDSVRKRMMTVNEFRGERTAYLKGAVEVVLDKCSSVIAGGVLSALSAEMRQSVVLHFRRMASRGERVIALAYRHGFDGVEEGFTFVALVGLIDPPRREIRGAVEKCRSAGIKVIMITGDYGVTAEAVARIAGVIDERGANVMRGDELDSADDAALTKFLSKDNLIFARTSPMQKLRIVKALQAMGEVVTVTGDGVNDAPALKHADMGVAMGVSGTEVAKEASDMVLLDDNFATIVSAIEEGRTVYGNIRKFIAYILTSNVPEILPFVAFAFLAVPLPLTVVLILSIDLGTDLLPALGLGAETPEDDVMKLKPRKRTDRLLTAGLLFKSYVFFGLIQAAAGFYAYFTVLYSGGWSWGQGLAASDPLYLKAVTAFFVSIVFCQVANVMICRTGRQSVFGKGIFSNRLILFGIAAELLLVLALVHYPPLQRFFGTTHLTLGEMALAAPFAALILLADELRKLIVRRGGVAAAYLDW